jgi:hypothetical protein
VVSAGIFSALHFYSLPGFASTFCGGFIWAMVFEKSHSLLPGIVIHAFYNGLYVMGMLLVYPLSRAGARSRHASFLEDANRDGRRAGTEPFTRQAVHRFTMDGLLRNPKRLRGVDPSDRLVGE